MADRAWCRPSAVPLDLNGPIGVAFETPPPDFADSTISDLFQARVEHDSAATAVIGRLVRLSFADVHAQAISLARRIIAVVPRGKAVALWLPADASLPVAILACLIAGRTCLVLNNRYPAARLAGIIRDAAPTAMVYAVSDHDGCIPDETIGIPLHNALTADDQCGCYSDATLGPDDPAVVLYTSGSTGQPKGIVLTQRMILCRVRQVVLAWHMNSTDRFLSLSTPPTIPGLTGCIAALLTGCAQIVGDLLQDGMGRMLMLGATEAATILVGLPALLSGIMELHGARSRLAMLRIVRTTGDALLCAELDAWRRVLPPDCHIMTTFGSTEMNTFAQWFVPRNFRSDAVRVPVGYPLPDHEYMLADESGGAVAAGEIGELALRSRNIALGEWREGRCVAGRFATDADEPSKRILFTGDLMRQRGDGLIEFVGRQDDQVKIRGQRVELAEIERQLRADPCVDDAAVAAERDGADMYLHGFVVSPGTDPGARTEIAAMLRARLSRTLPDYMVPSRVVFVASLPRLASGKVDRRALLGDAG